MITNMQQRNDVFELALGQLVHEEVIVGVTHCALAILFHAFTLLIVTTLGKAWQTLALGVEQCLER